ncbi:MAG: hypothetical protein HKL95_09960 [Phycisphaerae bacterium]|nr:hypothetical protein [Phycisphaerae bacterium]
MPRTIVTHWQHAPTGATGSRDAHCLYPGVPVAIDMQKRVGRNRIIYNGPAAIWPEGLPMGNGDLAAMAFQPADSLCWGLTKSDVRDLRHPVVPWCDHPTIRRIFENEHNHLLTDQINEEEWDFRTYFPCFLPAGGLWLSALHQGELAVKRQVLDLYQAQHTLELVCGGQVTSFVYADANVLAIRLTGMNGRRLRLRFGPEAVEPGHAGDDNSPTAQLIRKEIFRRQLRHWQPDQGRLQVDYADGHRTLLMLQIRGATLGFSQPDANEATVDLQADTVDILMTIATSRQGAFLQRRASLLLETAWQRNVDRLLADHHNCWHERWSRSAVHLPQRILESLWFYASYTMASSSRGAYPTPLMSAWNLRLDQPYGGDFHNNINSQMCYWPLPAANHADLMPPFLKHFWSVIPEMEMETRRVWNLPGIKVPFASMGRGIDHWGVGYWRYELFVSAWLAQVAWWHYEFTGDRQALLQFGWPLIQGVAEFYMAYLETDPATGKLSLPLTKLCEDTMFNVVPAQRLVRDAGLDLTAVHSHLRDAAQAADVIGQPQPAARYRSALANLNPLPVVGGEFSPAPAMAMDVPVSHPYQLAAIYPAGLVTQLGPASLLPIAQRTLAQVWRCSSRVSIGQPDTGRLRWNDDLSMGWIATARAWMGDGDGALDALLNGWVTSTLKTNGFLTEQSRRPSERSAMGWMQNQLCGLANGINEMLLQSHSGVIQIFPALPGTWTDVSFVHLVARPGVRVSARRSGGIIRWVVLSAEKQNTVCLRNPWPGQALESLAVVDTSFPDVLMPVAANDAGHLLLTILPNQPLMVVPKDRLPLEPVIDAPHDDGIEPWSFTGPIPLRPGDPQPDGTWTSWWGKP